MENLINIPALVNTLRRLWWVPVLTLLAGIGFSIDFGRKLPKIYQANTLILVEPQKIPTNYVKPIITTPIENRLKTIQQQVTSRSRIETIIESEDLFPTLRGKTPMEDLVARVNRGIRLEVRGTSTFRIYYEDRNPQVAARVANALAELFISENVNSRKAEAKSTTSFLEQQLAESKTALEHQEKLITEFKKTHLAELPAQRDVNFRMLEGFRNRLQTTMDAISKEEDRKILLQSQLADLPQTGGTSKLTVAQQLDDLRKKLVDLRGIYTEQHPEVTLLKRQIAQLEEDLKKQEDAPDPNATASIAPSMREQQLNEQISESDLRLKDLRRDADRLQKDIDDYESRLANAPKNEQQLLTLQRDYDIMQQSYLELLRNKTQAEMAESLEQERQGEQFVVLDKAVPPARPYKPNLTQIVGIGSVAGFLIGIGIALMFDVFRPRFRTEDELVAAYGIPVLVSIPAVSAGSAVGERHWSRKLLLGTGILVALIVAVAVIGFMAGWGR